ncbi:hypothetical protein ACFL2V_14090 [Pseudomonadota bacterium]
MNDAWVALTKYKLLSEKVNALKKQAFSELPAEIDVEESIRDAEEELMKLKAWIDMHYEMKRAD